MVAVTDEFSTPMVVRYGSNHSGEILWVSQRPSLLPESNCVYTEYAVTRKVALETMGRHHNFQLRYDQSIELLPSAN